MPAGNGLVFVFDRIHAAGTPKWPAGGTNYGPNCVSMDKGGNYVAAADGTPLYARMIKPAGFQSGKTYPAVVMVYGGPGVTEVYGPGLWMPSLLGNPRPYSRPAKRLPRLARFISIL